MLNSVQICCRQHQGIRAATQSVVQCYDVQSTTDRQAALQMKYKTYHGILEGAVVEDTLGPEGHLPDQEQLRDEPDNKSPTNRKLLTHRVLPCTCYERWNASQDDQLIYTQKPKSSLSFQGKHLKAIHQKILAGIIDSLWWWKCWWWW